MKTNLKKELKNWIPALEEIIEQKWDEQYENDRDMANDWAESNPFEKIACEKAKNISSKELMKLVFDTIYLADENESHFDIQDIECQDESESIKTLLKVFVSEAVLYLVRKNEIETSEMFESEVAKKIMNIIKAGRAWQLFCLKITKCITKKWYFFRKKERKNIMKKEKEENIFEDTSTILSEFSEFDDDENESDEEDDKW